MARDLGNGEINAVRADLQDGLHYACQNEGERVGAHGTRFLILRSRNLVISGINVPGVNGRERGEAHLKLCSLCLPEQCVKCKAKRGQLDQSQESVGRDLSLHPPAYM